MLAENVLVHNSYSERANLSNTVASNLEINRAREKVTKKGSQTLFTVNLLIASAISTLPPFPSLAFI